MFDTNSWQLEDITFVLNEYSELLKWGYKDETVLHFGCGSGFITGKFLLPHLPASVQVVGVEEDHHLADFAKKYHEHENLEFRKLKDIKDCVFDHILSFYYFKEDFDELKLFSTFNKYLSNNGDLLVILLNQHSVLTILDKLNQTQTKYQGKVGKAKIKTVQASKSNLLQAMATADFSDTIHKCYERYHIFPNRNALKNFLRSNLVDSQLSEEEFDEFMNDFMTLMDQQDDVKHIGRNGNVLALPYKLTFLYGKKKY